jgi:hypothetical protein
MGQGAPENAPQSDGGADDERGADARPIHHSLSPCLTVVRIAARVAAAWTIHLPGPAWT